MKIEKAFASWIVGLGFNSGIVYTGLSAKEAANDKQNIIASLDTEENPAGPLWRASMKLIISTPPHAVVTGNAPNHDQSLALHNATTDAIRDALDPYPASLNSAIAAQGLTSLKGKRMGCEHSVEDGRWVSTINVIAGYAMEPMS